MGSETIDLTRRKLQCSVKDIHKNCISGEEFQLSNLIFVRFIIYISTPPSPFSPYGSDFKRSISYVSTSILETLTIKHNFYVDSEFLLHHIKYFACRYASKFRWKYRHVILHLFSHFNQIRQPTFSIIKKQLEIRCRKWKVKSPASLLPDDRHFATKNIRYQLKQI